MKKSDQQHCNSNAAVGSRKSIFKTNSLETDSKSQRQHTSRVKFKDNVGCSKVKTKSVQFIRNTSAPVRKTHSVVSFTPCTVDNEDRISDKIIESDKSSVTNDVKLDVPELCTSLRFANKLLDQAARETKKTLHSLPSTETNTAKIKVARKVNIPFEEQQYKDLVDLKVNENDLFPEIDKWFKPKQFVRNKEKEPDLSEFYKPSYDQEFVIKPDKLKIEPEKVIHYNGFSISDRTKRWESS